MEQFDSPSSAPTASAGQALEPAAPSHTALPDRDDGTPRSPDEYDWIPVLRKPRADGWTPLKQREFIEALADHGSVAMAAIVVGMSEQSCYRLRRAPGSEGFRAAWSAAIDAASSRLIDEAFERALIGSDEPVFDREGVRIGRRHRKSDRLLMFLLKAYAPERFGSVATASAAAPPPPPVAVALRAIVPPAPEAPQLLMSPDELDDALLCADILDGKAPPWRVDPTRPTDDGWMGDELERQLEDAKRENAGKPPLTDAEWKVLRDSRRAHLS